MLGNKKVAVVALGYFDSVHVGHQKVINTAKKIAENNQAALIIVTFSGNLKAAFSGGEDKVVYTTEEREILYKSFGVEHAFFAPVSKEFLSMSGEEFLALINNKYDVKTYVCGEDYRFGKDGKSNKDDIEKYAKAHNQECVVVSLLYDGEDKISTTKIKKLLSKGEVEKANVYLGRSYSLSGVVFEDRKKGRKLGFPTVNVRLDKDKFNLYNAVYKGHVVIENRRYETIINYGARPTFSLGEKLVEAHIVDFCGDLYGQNITLFFDCFMRDIKKFSSEEQLKIQLEKDLRFARMGKYD